MDDPNTSRNKHKVAGMKITPELADSIFSSANWVLVAALILGVLATYAIVVSGKVRDQSLKLELQKSSERIALLTTQGDEARAQIARANQTAEEERLARVKIEARLAPRNLNQMQQNELTAKLAGLEKQIGFVQASPSLPESEWFARVLAAPLRAAGWDISPINGTSTATTLHPKGVVITYRMDSTKHPSDSTQEIAALKLADELNKLDIDASAIPGLLVYPETIRITITPK